jgi:WD40 repeat protein
MMLYGERVLYTSHLQKTSTETFEEMASFFDTKALRKYLKDIKTALGREQIILKSGARVKFLARTRNGGRGQHGDLLIFDEAQELDSDAQASFIPAISASLNPQTIYVGTPPDPNAEGTVFRGIRDKAIKGETKTTAWFEYSVKEIGDVTKRERWAQANPALGRRILLSTVEGECEQMDPDTFARERLGWWTPVAVQKIEYAIPEKTWDSCASEALKPEGKTAYGVKFSPDGSEVALCGAVEDADGIIRISLIDRRPTGQGTQWLADWLNERSTKACCVLIDGRNGVDVLIDKISHIWRFKGSIIRPSVKDIIASVSMLTDALNEHKLTWYSKQIDLRDSAVTSTKRPISGGWGFGGDNSIPIEACSLAMWGVKTSKRNPSKSMRIG